MTFDELGVLVVERMRALAPDLGLAADNTGATYRLNPGGFVCAAFTIADGSRTYHLKLAAEDDGKRNLRRWERVAPLLSERYRAPRWLGWVDIPGTPWGGPLLEHVGGRIPAPWPDIPLVDEVASLVHTLHADRDLAGRLSRGADLRDSFLGYHVAICASDLDELTESGDMPPFVDGALVDWMHEQVAWMRDAARGAAFDGPATTPVHGDLWEGNLLVAQDRTWHVIDWDEVALGDPALDLVLLLFGAEMSGHDPARWLGRWTEDAAFLERFRIMTRATALVGVIDSLADWADAGKAPAHVDAVRVEKERDHRSALELYRARYG